MSSENDSHEHSDIEEEDQAVEESNNNESLP